MIAVSQSAPESSQTTSAGGAEGQAHVYCIDAHAHYYPAYDPLEFLNSAAAQFARALPRGNRTGVLMFADLAGQDSLDRVKTAADTNRLGPWRIDATEEKEALLASGPTGRLLLIAGRQVRSQEGVEVLTLGAALPLSDHLPLAQCLGESLASNGVTVLPWGFGKWQGARRRLIEQLLMDTARQGRHDGSLFVGDSGLRPLGVPRSRLFLLAEQLGLLVLPGSDPLPFARHSRSIGRYGLFLRGRLETVRPAAHLKSLLTSLERQPDFFGRRASMWAAACDQLAMQVRARLAAVA